MLPPPNTKTYRTYLREEWQPAGRKYGPLAISIPAGGSNRTATRRWLVSSRVASPSAVFYGRARIAKREYKIYRLNAWGYIIQHSLDINDKLWAAFCRPSVLTGSSASSAPSNGTLGV